MANYSYDDAVSIMKSYGKTKTRGKETVGTCPVCGDNHHLFLARGTEGADVVVYCQKCNAGAKDIFSAWERDGHKPTIVFDSDESKQEWMPGATWYPYKTETGEVAFYKKRKEYYDVYPDGTRKRKKITPYFHADKLTKGQPKEYKDTLHIYNLHELATSEPGTVLFIVEGEKCADALMKLGVLAITTKSGAKIGTDTVKLTAREQELVNRHTQVIVMPDNDEAGWSYAEAWANYVSRLCVLDVKRLKTDAPEKYDVADWLEGGGSVAELMQMEPIPYDSSLSPYADKWKGSFTLKEPTNNDSKEVIPAEPLPTQELDESLDPAEWQKEDFRNREKLSALFKHIYINNDRFLLETLKDRAKELKVTGVATLWAEFKKDLDKKVNAAEIAKQKSKLVLWTDAENFKLSPYTTSANGIYKEVMKKEETVFVKILSVPLLPVTILTNMETGNVKTRLRWKHKNRSAHEEIVDNRILADRSKILSLASRGLPVDSTNALDVVEYLSVITANNDDIIPHEESVSSLGWHSNNEKFSPYDTDIIIDNVTENITMFRSIKDKGTLDEWSVFIARYMTDKRFHIVMAASFASVILRLVGTLPFILHFWGKTGTGKTVALMAAASVYGNPTPGAYLRSMDATTNATMRVAGFLRNLPIIADEMQTVRDREGNYDRFVMRVTEGVERGRLNSDSTIKALLEWNNILITSGEEPIVNIRSGAGAVNRVIEVELDATEPLFPGNLGNKVANFCREHYGTAAPEFIRQVKEMGAEKLKELYNTKAKMLMSDSLSAKQVLSAAAILTGSELANSWIFGNAVEPLQVGDILPYLKTELTVDPAERSYTALMNCFAANKNRFMSQKDDNKTIQEYEPIGGEIWGKAFDGGYFVNKGILERELQNIGFQFNAVKKQWADKGYLIKDNKGGYYHQRYEDGQRCEYVYMKT